MVVKCLGLENVNDYEGYDKVDEGTSREASEVDGGRRDFAYEQMVVQHSMLTWTLDCPDMATARNMVHLGASVLAAVMEEEKVQIVRWKNGRSTEEVSLERHR